MNPLTQSNMKTYGKSLRDRNNEHAVKVQKFALKATEKLVSLGHAIESVNLQSLKPIIEIQYQRKRCDALDGRIHKRCNNGSSMNTVMFTEFHHCVVQWTVPSYVEDLDRMSKPDPKNDKFNYRNCQQGA